MFNFKFYSNFTLIADINNKRYILDYTLLFKLVIFYILFVIIGTITHESGHLLISKALGYKDSKIRYASTHIGHTRMTDSLDFFRKKFRNQLKSKINFPEKKIIDELSNRFNKDRSYITWGGPLETMLVGTIGIVILFVRRIKINEYESQLSTTNWFLIFITLFWLRQVLNCFIMIVNFVKLKKYGRGDEVNLSNYYGFPPYTLSVVSCLLGSLIFYYMFFKLIPQKQRFTFLISTIIGAPLGYVIWLKVLGPVSLP